LILGQEFLTMDQTKRYLAGLGVALAAVLIALLYFGVTQMQAGAQARAAQAQQTEAIAALTKAILNQQNAGALGISNYDSLTLDNDLVVGGTVNVTGATTLTGAVTGKVLRYPTPGIQEICGTSNVTTTTTISHGLATPSYVVVSIGQDASADGSLVTYTNSAGVVTLKGWNRAAVPTPVTTPVAVSWCVIGTP
jgi:hypothetical protein